MAFEVFESFRFFGDEAVFDIRRAVEVIQAYGDRRVREALRPRACRVVKLRLVRLRTPRERFLFLIPAWF